MTIRGILCDLDGVVYRGQHACPGAVEGLTAAREAGVRVLFMTNNASRPPQSVAQHLTDLGLVTGADEVLTASQVAASVLADETADTGETEGAEIADTGETEGAEFADAPETAPAPATSAATVLAVGGPGVALALEEEGFTALTPAQVRSAVEAGQQGPRIDAVVQGYGADVSALDLAEAAYAIAEGAAWVATNDDATLPTARGLAPGNGSLVAAVAHATGAVPRVVGKPHAPAYQVALDRLGVEAAECLMIGDRLNTDIAGARAVGLASALVLTGVSTREEAAAADERQRPDHVVETIPDLAHLWSAS